MPKPFFNSRLKHLSGSRTGQACSGHLSCACQSLHPRHWVGGRQDPEGAQQCPGLVSALGFTARIHNVLPAYLGSSLNMVSFSLQVSLAPGTDGPPLSEPLTLCGNPGSCFLHGLYSMH